MKRVVRIMGTAYSGSTLLNHLLDVQPGVRGISEAYHWFNPQSVAYCPKCEGPLKQCEMYKYKDDQQIWKHLFEEQYPDDDVIVDTSKHPGLLWRRIPAVPDEYRCQVIVLSKMPHEFSYSYIKHNPDDEVGRAMLLWLGCYDAGLKFLEAGLDHTRKHAAHYNVPKLSARDICKVSYRELALDHVGTVRRICDQLDLPFDEEATKNPWDVPTDTCMVGGNNAVYAQRTKNEEFFRAEGAHMGYLDDKYRGKQGVVFLDEQWRKDGRYRKICNDYYTIRNVFYDPFDAVAKGIGYARGCEGFVEDLAKETGAD
jgi:hypothetical protein